MKRQSLIPVVAACALAFAGCGGGGGGGGGGDGVITEDQGTVEIDTNSTVYQAAFGVCSSASPKEIKSNYRTTSTKPDDIAHQVALNLAGGTPGAEANAEAGCRAGLKAFQAG
jgi:hypothetical protein